MVCTGTLGRSLWVCVDQSLFGNRILEQQDYVAENSRR